MNKTPKKTKQEIKDYIKIRWFYFLIQVMGRNIAFSFCIGMVVFIVHMFPLFPLNNILYIIIDTIVTFIIIELIFQRSIYKNAYKEYSGDNKFILNLFKIMIVPIILYYLINLMYFYARINFLFTTETEFLYMLITYGEKLLIIGKYNKYLREFFNGYIFDFNINIYTISFVICTAFRFLITAITISIAHRDRARDRDKII